MPIFRNIDTGDEKFIRSDCTWLGVPVNRMTVTELAAYGRDSQGNITDARFPQGIEEVVPVTPAPTPESAAENACMRACKTFDSAIADGCQVSFGYTMQAEKDDYRTMSDGLDVVLNSPDHANGDLNYEVTVVDINDVPHNQTIAEAYIIRDEMLANYWTLWNQKTDKRNQVASILANVILTDEEKITQLDLIN